MSDIKQAGRTDLRETKKCQIAHKEVSTGEVDEEENHSVFVVERQPLPQQVDQGVKVDCQTHHQLHGVDCDADNICHSEPDH